MTGYGEVAKAMVQDAIHLRVDAENLDFEAAKSISDAKAKEKADDPMLLAWFDKKTGRFSPKVDCCGGDKPAWLVYAESRGGTVMVCINDGEFVFVYRGLG